MTYFGYVMTPYFVSFSIIALSFADVLVNGRDERGQDLVVNGDYLSAGIRERANELATLELGPVTEIEQRHKLTAEIEQDRLTRIDRAMIAEAADHVVDLRHEPDDLRSQSDRTLRLRRLGKLGDMGLAAEKAPGVWELSERLEPTLREMGERGDIVRATQKALRAEGAERDPMTFAIHDAAPATPVMRRVVDRHLTDELGENLTLVIDGIDGRTHRVSDIEPSSVEDARIGSARPVAAGHRPSAQARGVRDRTGRIGVVTDGTAAGIAAVASFHATLASGASGLMTFSSPHAFSARMTGSSVRPRGVRLYSTFGGTSG